MGTKPGLMGLAKAGFIVRVMRWIPTASESRPNPAEPFDMLNETQYKATATSALASFDSLPDAAHVRLPVVAGLNSISPATVWRWVKAGRICPPVKLGPNVTAWKVGDLRRAGGAL